MPCQSSAHDQLQGSQPAIRGGAPLLISVVGIAVMIGAAADLGPTQNQGRPVEGVKAFAPAPDAVPATTGASISKPPARVTVRTAEAREPTTTGASFWIDVAQLAIGALGVVGLLLTVLYARGAWQAAVRSAKTADDTYKAMRDGERRQLRAYLYVMNNTTPSFEGDGILEGRFLLKNAGQTPALRVRSANAMCVGRLPFESDPPAISEEWFKGGGVLAPGATMRLICRISEPPPPKWRDALVKKSHAVCMYGEIRYEDIFGEEHITKYRAMYSGPVSEGLDEILWCREGNEAT